jgi:phenylalanyl-tRNA synthetase beta chain
VPAARVLSLARGLGGGLLESAQVFDFFQGGNLPVGKKSLGVRVVLGSYDRALTPDEVEGFSRRLAAAVRSELGGQLRQQPGAG